MNPRLSIRLNVSSLLLTSTALLTIAALPSASSCRAARWAVRRSAGCRARNARQARTAAGCSAEAQAAGAAASKATASGRAATRANTTATAPGSDAATRCSGETAGSKRAAATRPSRAAGAGGAGAPRGAPGRTPPRPATAGAGRAAASRSRHRQPSSNRRNPRLRPRSSRPGSRRPRPRKNGVTIAAVRRLLRPRSSRNHKQRRPRRSNRIRRVRRQLRSSLRSGPAPPTAQQPQPHRPLPPRSSRRPLLHGTTARRSRARLELRSNLRSGRRHRPHSSRNRPLPPPSSRNGRAHPQPRSRRMRSPLRLRKPPTPPWSRRRPRPATPANSCAATARRRRVASPRCARSVRNRAKAIAPSSARVIAPSSAKATAPSSSTTSSSRFAIGARNVHVERRGANTETIVERGNGIRIVTVNDSEGRLLRRFRRDAGGREVVIIDNSFAARRGAMPLFVQLAAAGHSHSARALYRRCRTRAARRHLRACSWRRRSSVIDQPYTLDQVRFSAPLRDRMPRVDLDVNFDTGSWQLSPEQVERLVGRSPTASTARSSATRARCS